MRKARVPLTLAVIALTACVALARHPMIAEDVDTNPAGALDVIVQYRSAPAELPRHGPTLFDHEVKARLMKTASKAFPGATTDDDPAGAGYVDVAEALTHQATDTGWLQFVVWGENEDGTDGFNVVWGTLAV